MRPIGNQSVSGWCHFFYSHSAVRISEHQELRWNVKVCEKVVFWVRIVRPVGCHTKAPVFDKLGSYLLLLFEMKSNKRICACMCERHPGERGLMSSSSSSSKYIILHTKNVHSPSLHLTLHPPPSPPPRQTPSFGLIYHTYLILTPTFGGRSSSLSSSQ